ncbi:MAG: hypothetical protein ACPIA7_06315 [Akkermansiaceae bacterium]
MVLLSGCAGDAGREKPWVSTIRHELGYLGARNWVIVAEAAFPIHSRRGLSVVQINGEIPVVVDAVERVIEEKSHVKPRLYVATEAGNVPYDYAPGIKNYRAQLKQALHGRETVQIEHSILLEMLNDASKTYRVLVLKTRSALPYTSVFMELGSGYWDAESESALREVMENERKP